MEGLSRTFVTLIWGVHVHSHPAFSCRWMILTSARVCTTFMHSVMLYDEYGSFCVLIHTRMGAQ